MLFHHKAVQVNAEKENAFSQSNKVMCTQQGEREAKVSLMQVEARESLVNDRRPLRREGV